MTVIWANNQSTCKRKDLTLSPLPLGQLIIVTSGKGRTQCEGEEREEINAGDTIWCPPDHKHWHGATAITGVSYIIVQEMQEGKNVEWLEAVTDEEYLQ